MTYITRIHLSILLMLSFCFVQTKAQRQQQNLQYEDLKPYHFGLVVGIHTQDLIPKHSGTLDSDGRIWHGTVSDYSPGFSVGVLGDLRLTDFLSLRTSPAIHFGNKIMTMYSDDVTINPVVSNLRSNYVLIPLNIRYRGARTDNYRPYILTGFSAGFDIGRDKNQPLLLKTVNLFWEIGAGIDLYMPYFKLVPELKFCLGLGDNLVHNRTDQSSDTFTKYAAAFDALTSRLLVFSLQIE